MTQTTSRFFDDIAKLMTNAAGAAKGVREEVETMMRSQAEKILRELDVVQREEFEAVKEMARRAREENEDLRKRLDALSAAPKRGAAAKTTLAATVKSRAKAAARRAKKPVA